MSSNSTSTISLIASGSSATHNSTTSPMTVAHALPSTSNYGQVWGARDWRRAKERNNNSNKTTFSPKKLKFRSDIPSKTERDSFLILQQVNTKNYLRDGVDLLLEQWNIDYNDILSTFTLDKNERTEFSLLFSEGETRIQKALAKQEKAVDEEDPYNFARMRKNIRTTLEDRKTLLRKALSEEKDSDLGKKRIKEMARAAFDEIEKQLSVTSIRQMEQELREDVLKTFPSECQLVSLKVNKIATLSDIENCLAKSDDLDDCLSDEGFTITITYECDGVTYSEDSPYVYGLNINHSLKREGIRVENTVFNMCYNTVGAILRKMLMAGSGFFNIELSGVIQDSDISGTTWFGQNSYSIAVWDKCRAVASSNTTGTGLDLQNFAMKCGGIIRDLATSWIAPLFLGTPENTQGGLELSSTDENAPALYYSVPAGIDQNAYAPVKIINQLLQQVNNVTKIVQSIMGVNYQTPPLNTDSTVIAANSQPLVMNANANSQRYSAVQILGRCLQAFYEASITQGIIWPGSNSTLNAYILFICNGLLNPSPSPSPFTYTPTSMSPPPTSGPSSPPAPAPSPTSGPSSQPAPAPSPTNAPSIPPAPSPYIWDTNNDSDSQGDSDSNGFGCNQEKEDEKKKQREILALVTYILVAFHVLTSGGTDLVELVHRWYENRRNQKPDQTQDRQPEDGDFLDGESSESTPLLARREPQYWFDKNVLKFITGSDSVAALSGMALGGVASFALKPNEECGVPCEIYGLDCWWTFVIAAAGGAFTALCLLVLWKGLKPNAEFPTGAPSRDVRRHARGHDGNPEGDEKPVPTTVDRLRGETSAEEEDAQVGGSPERRVGSPERDAGPRVDGPQVDSPPATRIPAGPQVGDTQVDAPHATSTRVDDTQVDAPRRVNTPPSPSAPPLTPGRDSGDEQENPTVGNDGEERPRTLHAASPTTTPPQSLWSPSPPRKVGGQSSAPRGAFPFLASPPSTPPGLGRGVAEASSSQSRALDPLGPEDMEIGGSNGEVIFSVPTFGNGLR